jgi:hypothetical protein
MFARVGQAKPGGDGLGVGVAHDPLVERGAVELNT